MTFLLSHILNELKVNITENKSASHLKLKSEKFSEYAKGLFKMNSHKNVERPKGKRSENASKVRIYRAGPHESAFPEPRPP